ncbi:hypothetical protein AaE_001358 [Aphanomyces astaci]|uniref:Selenoprotein O n=1 Tax=Aphanomyces astaci TaxID=112090 RepID=A0A6A5AZ44_APHAT|nr:hypothetical protein AaE_001358 [Aphanomyces astaci]
MLTFVQREYYDIHGQDDDLEGSTHRFLHALTQRTAALVAKWQSVGFCHGVLNTDNMSIVGDTLDYGPFGFMEYFDAGHICNTSDNSGRYAYDNQPEICKWNCHMLVNQWTLLFNDTVLADLHALVDATFDAAYQSEFTTLVERKLGLPRHDPDTNAALVASFWATLTDTHADFTCVFRALSGVSAVDGASADGVLQTLVGVSHSLAQAQVAAQPPVPMSPDDTASTKRQMHAYKTLDTLTKQVADYEAFVASDLTPQGFKQTQENRWQLWLDQYQQHLAKYGTDADADVARRQAMNATNPKFILRNHVAQKAINAASAGDLATVSHILHLLTHPFDDANECDAAIYSQPSDPNAPPLLVSCSS